MTAQERSAEQANAFTQKDEDFATEIASQSPRKKRFLMRKFEVEQHIFEVVLHIFFWLFYA